MSQTAEQPIVSAPGSSEAVQATRWQTAWPLALFAVLWVDLIRQLSYTWETREQYSYGWFVPLFALYLVWRRWMGRPAPTSNESPRWPTVLVGLVLLALLPLRVIFEINADWPLISWLYAMMVVGLTLHAWYLAGGQSWVRHFAFPTAFILLAIAWPYRIEKGLTQNLMQVVANFTVEILGFLDIPAMQRGNLIEVSTGVVGVDEACSGIRSFQSTLMASLLMGELYRLRLRPRLAMLGCGLLLAFGFNILRTLLLSWQANAHGVAAIGKWHDGAGLTILVACFISLWILAMWIQSHWKGATGKPGAAGVAAPAPATEPPMEHASSPQLRRHLVWVGGAAVLALVATEGWYRGHDIRDEGAFHWTATFPTNNPGFAQLELPPRTLQLINADIMTSGKWRGMDGSDWSLFFFRWNPASISSVLRARIHRPDRCLPASGYQQIADDGVLLFETAGLRLPFRRYTYNSDGGTIHVFFCQWEDGSERQRGLQVNNQAGRLQSVLNGRRRLGQQTLEIVLSGCASQQDADALVKATLPQLVKKEDAASDKHG